MRKRLILINSCKGLYGGVESFLLNIFYQLNQDEFEVTFLTCGTSTYDMFREDILKRGGYIDEIPIYANSIKKQRLLYSELRLYYREKKPDIVHINSGGLSFHLLAGKAAKDEGIKGIILHSHNFIPSQKNLKEFVKGLMKRKLKTYGTHYLACSKGAAEWIFSKSLVEQGHVEIIPNGIDTEKFTFDAYKRKLFRDELGIKNELVIGNIGRFQSQKNHYFIIRMMKKVTRTISDAKLLLVGKGELQIEIEEYVNKLNLDKNVIFLGERRDMDAFLSGIDVFILPSLHEGFPVVAVEALASGVRVLLSDKIPKETDVTGRAIYLPIKDNQDELLWAKMIYENTFTDDNRTAQGRKVADAGYDVKNYCNRMEEIYRSIG